MNLSEMVPRICVQKVLFGGRTRTEKHDYKAGLKDKQKRGKNGIEGPAPENKGFKERSMEEGVAELAQNYEKKCGK